MYKYKKDIKRAGWLSMLFIIFTLNPFFNVYGRGMEEKVNSLVFITYSIKMPIAFLTIILLLISIIIVVVRLIRVESKLKVSNERLLKVCSNVKDYEKKLEDIAYKDFLTELPNKSALHKEFKEKFAGSKKQGALIFMDIDNFKLVNDVLGHTMGDKLLIEIVKRLSLLINKNTTLFRLGGDELIFYIDNFQNEEEINRFVAEVLKNIKKSIKIEENKLYISASAGVVFYPKDGDSIDILLQNADIAMYKAKALGKNTYKFFNVDYVKQMKESMLIERCLRKALYRDEFSVYYQPKVRADGLEIVGFESLLRWNSSELGFVCPNDFIRIAEATGLIIPLGEMVLRKSCEFIKKLNETLNKSYNISVNVSVIQIMQDSFTDRVSYILKKTGINPCNVELEITESILMDSPNIVIEKLQTLRAKGIKIALDDFGKEYSSLNYLKILPIDTIKIDKLFIDDICKADNKKILTDTIIYIGHKMGLETVAEGVETAEQLNYLKLHGCDKIQGYIFSRPIPEIDIYKLIEDPKIIIL